MNKCRLLVLSLLFLKTLDGFAQPVPKNTYDKAVDFTICKIIYESLKTVAAQTKDAAILREFEELCPCDSIGDLNYGKMVDFLKNKGKNFDKTISAAVELENLKDYDVSNKTQILTQLTNDIFLTADHTKYPNIKQFAQKRRGEEFNIFQLNLKNGVQNLLDTYTPTPTQTTTTTPKPNTVVAKNETKKTKHWTDWLVAAAAVLGVSVAIWSLIRTLNLNERINALEMQLKTQTHKDNTDQNNAKGNENMLDNTFKKSVLVGFEEHKNQIDHLTQAVKKVFNSQKEIKEIVADFSHQEPAPVIQNDKIFAVQTPKPEPKLDIALYFSTPNKDGSFSSNGKSDLFKHGASFYKFTLINENTAHFQFVEDRPTVEMALNSPNTYIEPACNDQNTYFMGSKSFITTQKGTATLQGDKWLITQKALIKYE